ncbi:MAG: hypothetical protein WCP39_02050, partial [Chlamydiota bacterium]
SVNRLSGVFTTTSRSESFCSLINQIKLYTKKGDRIFAYPSISMVYFASEALPFANHSWIDLLDFEALHKKLQEFSEENFPVLVIKSKTNTSDYRWGGVRLNRKSCQEAEDMEKKIEIIDQVVHCKWKLTLVWSNLDFDVFLTSRH